jgi:hypothetical protein
MYLPDVARPLILYRMYCASASHQQRREQGWRSLTYREIGASKRRATATSAALPVNSQSVGVMIEGPQPGTSNDEAPAKYREGHSV